MAGHAALPELQSIERMRDVIIQFVEEDVAQTATQHDTEQSHQRDEVTDSFGLELSIPPAGQAAHDEERTVEAEDIGEAIPMQTDAVCESDNVRTEVVKVVGEHDREGGWLVAQRQLRRSKSVITPRSFLFSSQTTALLAPVRMKVSKTSVSGSSGRRKSGRLTGRSRTCTALSMA